MHSRLPRGVRPRLEGTGETGRQGETGGSPEVKEEGVSRRKEGLTVSNGSDRSSQEDWELAERFKKESQPWVCSWRWEMEGVMKLKLSEESKVY